MTTNVRTLDALRSPNFALLWSAQVVSGFGDKITLFALAFVTWELTRSALSTAFAVVIATVPYASFGFFGGAIADAVGHRRAMIACDLVRAASIGLIPIVLALGAPLAVVYMLVLVAALCTTVFNPARLAIVPDLVPRDRLGASNSMVYASDRTVEIVGALLAGFLVAALGVFAFYVDALTFILSALLLLRISMTEPARRSLSVSGMIRDTAAGFAVIRRTTVLWANTVFSLIAQLSLPVINGLTPVLIFREYGLGPEQFGAAEASIAVGAVVAGLALPGILSRYRKGPVIVAGFAAFGILLIAIAVSPSFPVTLALFALTGVANVVFFVPNVTLSQEVTPPALRARVFGVRMALLNLTWLPVILVTGAIADAVSVQALFAAAGLLTLGTALVGVRFRSVRDVA